jgi:cytochrome c peroxidase
MALALRFLGMVVCIGACEGGCSDDHATVTRLPAIPAPPPMVGSAAGPVTEEDLNPRLLRRFKPLAVLISPRPQALVDLGRVLYYEPLLSIDGSVSCNSCHPLDQFGVTHTALSAGIGGRLGRRNAPSTFNASLQFAQFWDGRAASSTEQVRGPLLNPDEMGMDEATLVTRLSAIDGYRRAFDAAFPGSTQPISLESISLAIAEFERGLLTPARWDQYLAGDRTALSAKEKEGAKIFANLGCMVCHEGQLLGGSMFQKVGVIIPWPNQTDRGRGELSHNPMDDMSFKVPGLRNVANTAPYFHDGSVTTLAVAIQMMARHQLGVSLTDEEASAIQTWMGSLTGTVPEDYVRRPAMPGARRP